MGSRHRIKETESARDPLLHSAAWLETILQKSPVPMFVIDSNHRITHWNEALENYSGINAEEVIGTTRHWRAFYPHERPCMADILVDNAPERIPILYPESNAKSALVDGAYEATAFFPHLGESGAWLYLNAVAIRDDGGRILGAVETLEDITRRKNAEDALRESREQYSSLFNSMLEGFAYCRMIYDNEGQPADWIYLSVNKAFEEITGLKNITGTEVTKAIPGIREAYPELFEVYGRVAQTGNPEQFDIYFSTVSKWLHISVYSPEKGFFFTVLVDITLHRKMEVDHERIRSWQAGVNRILESVLAPVPFEQKLKIITDGVVGTFGADFCRIWLIEKGDLCDRDCVHAEATEGPHVCRYRDKCLHLKASSGRYTHTDGKVHRRVPLGAYKIGRIASGKETSFITNNVIHDPNVHDQEWARDLGLVSFAGYRLKPPDSEILGVFAFFAKFEISPDMDAVIKGLSRAVALVIQKEIAEEKVTKSRDYYLKLFNDFPNPIWRSDTSAKCDYFNKEWLAFTGRTIEQEMGDGWAEGVHPDDLNRCVEIYHTAFDARESFQMEYRLMHHDGTFHWLLDCGKPFYDLDENFSGYIGACYDINERKQSEEAVQAAVTLIHMIDTMSVSECMSYTLDEAKRLTSSKIGFFHFLNPDEQSIQLIAGSTETNKYFFIPRESDRHYPVEKNSIWVECLRNRKPCIHNDNAVLSHKKGLPEGNIPAIRELVVPIFDEDRIVAIIGVGDKSSDYDEKDINVLTLLAKNAWTLIQRKQMVVALKESEYRFRELFNSMSNGVAVYRAVGDGADFEFVDFNHGAEIIEKKKKQDVAGRRVTEVFPGVQEFGLLDVFRRVWRSGQSEPYPLALYEDERVTSWRENYVYRLPSGEIVAIFDDVTDRKLAEEALKASEDRYRSLFEEAPISLWEEDFSELKNWIDTKVQEGIQDLASYFSEHPEEISQCERMVKIIHINRAAMVLFGAVSLQEFRNGLTTIFSKESRDAFREEIIAFSRGNPEFEKEIPLRTLQGDRKIIIMKVTVVPGYEKTFSRIFVSGIDITERKNIEEALHQTNKKLNMLSSITRHDILNLIMAIRGYLELSEDLVDNPELKNYMKKETEAVDSVQRQIEFTRYYQDIGIEEPKWQDMGEIVVKVMQQLNLSDITVENRLSGLEIFADTLIEKVFYNLTENSLHHGEHVTTISFSYLETGPGITITYRDNGVGISPEYRKRLFQKGFGKHTGLGLFLSREILSITGITIVENGEPGKGVNFEIVVPEGGYRFTAR